LDFRISQGSIATYCRWDGNLCSVYTENSSWINWWKKFENRSTFTKVIIKHQAVYFRGDSV